MFSMRLRPESQTDISNGNNNNINQNTSITNIDTNNNLINNFETP